MHHQTADTVHDAGGMGVDVHDFPAVDLSHVHTLPAKWFANTLLSCMRNLHQVVASPASA